MDLSVVIIRRGTRPIGQKWLQKFWIYVQIQYLCGRYIIQRKERHDVETYRLAANKGDMKAQIDLANAYYFGIGVMEDRTKAHKWWMEAAWQGDIESMKILFDNYWCGDGVTRDESESAFWIELAARSGDVYSQFFVGCMYFHGRGVKQDKPTGLRWITRAAFQGCELAMNYRGESCESILEIMDKTRILFICLGNICRSPAANAVMQQLVDDEGLSEEFYIDSAGIGPWHVGPLPDKRMIKHGARRGYMIDHIARQFNKDRDFNDFDYIVVMDDENYKNISWLAHNAEERKKIVRMSDFFIKYKGKNSVPDPYYGGGADFETALDLIEDGCNGILNSIRRKSK